MRELLFFIILLVLVTPVYSSEYLAEVYLAGKKIGNYIIYENNSQYMAEVRLFQDLGFPVKEDTPLKYLNDHAKVNFDPNRQILWLEPEDPLYFKKGIKKTMAEFIQYKDKEKSKIIDYKNIDYSVYHNHYSTGDSSTSYYIRGTGRLLNEFTYDLFVLPRKSFLSLERNGDVKLKLGFIPEHNQYGLMISNEDPSMYLSAFGKETYTPGFPVGSNVDIFRNNEYLQTINYTGQPIELPLAYGENIFTLIAKTPDGRILKETVKKSIRSLLMPPGRLTYQLSIGQDTNTKKDTYYARLSYGLTKDLTLSTQVSDKDQKLQLIGQLFNDKVTYSIGPAHSKDYGTGYNLSLGHTNFFINQLSYEKYKYTSLTGYLPVWRSVSVSFNHSENKTKLYTEASTKQDRVTVFGSIQNLFLSTWIGRNETQPGDSRNNMYGVRALYTTYRVQLESEYNVEVPERNHLLRQKTVSFGLNYRTDYGDIKVSQQYKAYPYESLKLDRTTATVNLYNFSLASLQGRYEYNHRDNSWSVYFMISGSFSKNGFSNKSLSGQSIVCFIPFADDNLNGEKDVSEKQLHAEIEIQNYKSVTANQFYTPCMELSPDMEYLVSFSDSFGYIPLYRNVKIKPDRGKTLNVYMPYIEIVEIEGNTGKDNQKVVLVRKDTSQIIATTTTRFGGYYLFQIPKNLKDMVTVELKD